MVRIFEMRDIERVMQLWLAGNLEAHGFVGRDFWISQLAGVEEQILRAEVYVYEQNGEIQGFVGMVGEYLAGIFVDGGCRSQGIGHELLDWIKKRYDVFSLKVYQRNRRAVEFYLREGLLTAAEGTDGDTGEAEYTMVWDPKRTVIGSF